MTDKKSFLPVMEEFYSIQGEGYHTGKAAYFIRMGGCDLGCKWCDVKESWNAGMHPKVSVSDILERLLACKANSVVVTGGEPLLYDLDELCLAFQKHEIRSFLETSGTEKLSGSWDWICLSPKSGSTLNKEIVEKADELKVIIETLDDFIWAETASKMLAKNCKLYLQPEWSCFSRMKDEIISYIKDNPKWILSLQTHKYLGIR